MAKRLKRAFTIVELVIVIAVIAILAAVLIPTFTTLIDKANESNDIALVKNLNTALVSKEATDEVNTMQDALDAAYEYGYTVDKLTPSSSGDIVWDEVNNRFALIKDGEVVFGEGTVSTGASLWRIAKDTKDFSATYSNYLAGKWTTVPVASTGVDVGTNEGLDVTYTNTDTDAGQTVTIRTNGGTLTVNGPADTVNHYDMAVKVKITAVAKNSYHEYGEVLGNIELASGRVVVENNATVSTILVTAQSADSIKVEVNSNATVGTVAAIYDNVITDANTTVPSTTNKVTEAVTVNDNFAGGLGTEKSPYLVATAGQFRNINSVSSANQTYFSQTANIDIDTSADSDSIVISRFNGVYNGNGFYINHSFNSQGKVAEYADELIDTVVNGVFNDVNYNMIPKDANYGEGAIFVMNASSVVFDNVDVYGVIRYNTNGRNQSPYIYRGSNVEFKNCDVHANIYTDEYSAVFVGYPMGGQSYSFENCTFDGEIVGANVALLFANSAQFNVSGTTVVKINNVVNNGTIMGYKQAGLVFATGTSTNEEEIASQIVSNNKVIAVTPLEGFSVSTDSSDKIVINEPVTTDVAYYTIVISQYETWYYKEQSVYTTGSTMVSIKKTVNADELSSLDLYAYELRQTNQGFDNSVVDTDTVKYALNSADYTVVTKDFAEKFDIVEANGQKYYLLKNNKTGLNNDEYIVISNPNVSVKVYAYNAEGDLLGIAQA